MAVPSVVNLNETHVFINDSSETSEVTSACHKFKIELRSAQKIIELLQEMINVPNRPVSTDSCYFHTSNSKKKNKKKNSKWIFV
jgi:23S rRNA C2498 (ribose-2'-O)-methylase RlmM